MFRVALKAQTWSLDVLVAASVFIVGIIIFFYIVSYSGDKGIIEQLSAESELIPEALISPDVASARGITIIIGNKVDTQRLKAFINKSYDQIKNELGVRSEFCIHFEDEDGNILDLDDNPDATKYSIGNPKLNLTFVNETGDEVVMPCGT